MSSSYDNVVGGKLRLKGKALDVKAEGMKKKNKKKRSNKNSYDQIGSVKGTELISDGMTGNADEDDLGGGGGDGHVDAAGGGGNGYEVHLTPAERRYMEQKEQIDVHKLAKTANKSHRDRIQDFNQYLANMSEHYDIPKVGPG